MLAAQKNFSGAGIELRSQQWPGKVAPRNTALHLEDAPSLPHSTRGVLQGGAPRGEIFICDTPRGFAAKPVD
jgi:hypothetical protein